MGHFGVASCAQWLNWKCGIALGAAAVEWVYRNQPVKPRHETTPYEAAAIPRAPRMADALVAFLETAEGEPLAVGRKTRTISPALRRTLKRPRHLVLLCRFHHTLLHEGGYGVVREGNDFLFWRTDGTVVPKVNDVQLSGTVPTLMDDQEELRIDARTTVSNMDFRRPDYASIVSVLCDRRQHAMDRKAASV